MKIAAALFALAIIGFFVFPGHTYLQSDTQIYIPMFEHIEHPELYSRDFLLSTSHVGLTVYDETAIGLRHLTHATFEGVLEGEQIVFRTLALWGVFLIATSFGLADAAALLVAACYGLGATIVWPAVLSVEYEPVPRGFAVAFVLLASGLLLNGRATWACAAASVGFLYHSPATIPFWILFFGWIIFEKRWRALWPFAVAVIILAMTFTAQRGLVRRQPFFATIDPQWEAVIRMRTTYDWIGMWPSGSILAFVLYCAIGLAALWRLWPRVTPLQRLLLAGFPLIGVASIAVSGLLLDYWKWALMAQVQPARAVLFTIVFGQVSCTLAALFAIRDRRSWEASLWFIPVFLPVVVPAFTGPFQWAQIITVLALVALATGTPVRWLAVPLVVVAACWMIPNYAHTSTYSPLHSAELDQLSDWARAKTPEQALFVFPVSGHHLEQGVFRVKALRSLYVDWKAGGQVNYFRDFALAWQRRWNEVSSGRLTVDDWRTRGVEYLVYSGPPTEPLTQPIFQNSRYRVYQIQP